MAVMGVGDGVGWVGGGGMGRGGVSVNIILLYSFYYK